MSIYCFNNLRSLLGFKKKCICFDTVNNGLINNTYKLPEYRLKEVRWRVSLQASKIYAF